MKIGIITFHFADNYGAVLQAYATQIFLKEQGHEVEIIDYAPKHMLNVYSLNPLIKAKRQIIFNILDAIKRYEQVHLFRTFREKQLIQSKVLDKSVLQKYTKDFDALIVGSDQVWNLDITHADDAYFLNFVKGCVKGIGYAVSLGKNNTSSEFIQMVHNNIHNFDSLSFREEKAAAFVGELTGNSYSDVTDPVLLLGRDEWSKISAKPKKFSDEAYVLLYQLEENHDLQNKAIEIAKEHNLKVYSIHPMCARYDDRVQPINNVGPSEFLWLIQNASFVCTNSFHGMAFSIIFQKKLVCISHETLGDRNRQLLSYFGLSQNENKVIDFEQKDYSCVEQKITFSKNWIKDAVESK